MIPLASPSPITSTTLPTAPNVPAKLRGKIINNLSNEQCRHIYLKSQGTNSNILRKIRMIFASQADKTSWAKLGRAEANKNLSPTGTSFTSSTTNKSDSNFQKFTKNDFSGSSSSSTVGEKEEEENSNESQQETPLKLLAVQNLSSIPIGNQSEPPDTSQVAHHLASQLAHAAVKTAKASVVGGDVDGIADNVLGAGVNLALKGLNSEKGLTNVLENTLNNLFEFCEKYCSADSFGHEIISNLTSDQRLTLETWYKAKQEMNSLKSQDGKYVKITNETSEEIEKRRVELQSVLDELDKKVEALQERIQQDKEGELFPVLHRHSLEALNNHFANLVEANKAVKTKYPEFDYYPKNYQQFLVAEQMINQNNPAGSGAASPLTKDHEELYQKYGTIMQKIEQLKLTIVPPAGWASYVTVSTGHETESAKLAEEIEKFKNGEISSFSGEQNGSEEAIKAYKELKKNLAELKKLEDPIREAEDHLHSYMLTGDPRAEQQLIGQEAAKQINAILFPEGIDLSKFGMLGEKFLQKGIKKLTGKSPEEASQEIIASAILPIAVNMMSDPHTLNSMLASTLATKKKALLERERLKDRMTELDSEIAQSQKEAQSKGDKLFLTNDLEYRTKTYGSQQENIDSLGSVKLNYYGFTDLGTTVAQIEQNEARLIEIEKQIEALNPQAIEKREGEFTALEAELQTKREELSQLSAKQQENQKALALLVKGDQDAQVSTAKDTSIVAKDFFQRIGEIAEDEIGEESTINDLNNHIVELEKSKTSIEAKAQGIYEQRVGLKQSEIAQHQLEYNSLKQTLEDKKVEFEQMKSQLAAAEKTLITELQGKVAAGLAISIDSDNAEAIEKQITADRAIRELEIKIESLTAEASKIDSELKTTIEQLEAIPHKEEIIDFRNGAQTLDGISRIVAPWQYGMLGFNQESYINSITEEISTLETKQEELIAQLGKTNRELAQTKLDYGEKNKQLWSELTIESATANSDDLNAMRQKLADHEDRIEQLSKELDNKKGGLITFMQSTTTYTEMAGDLAANLWGKLSGTTESPITADQRWQHKVKSLQSQDKELVADLTQANQEIQDLKAQLRTRRHEVRREMAAAQILAESDAESLRISEEINDLQARISAPVERTMLLKAAQSAVDNLLPSQLAAMAKPYVGGPETHAEDIANKKQQLANLQAESADLSRELTTLQKEKGQKLGALKQQLNEEKIKLESEIEEKDAAAREIEQEIQKKEKVKKKLHSKLNPKEVITDQMLIDELTGKPSASTERSQTIEQLIQNFSASVLTDNQITLMNQAKTVANYALGAEGGNDVLAETVDIFLMGMMRSMAMKLDSTTISTGIEQLIVGQLSKPGKSSPAKQVAAPITEQDINDTRKEVLDGIEFVVKTSIKDGLGEGILGSLSHQASNIATGVAHSTYELTENPALNRMLIYSLLGAISNAVQEINTTTTTAGSIIPPVKSKKVKGNKGKATA